MALTLTKPSPAQAAPHNGREKYFLPCLASGKDLLDVTYIENLNGTADATEIQTRDAIKALLYHGLKDSAFLTALKNLAQTDGVTSPASLISAITAKLVA